MDRPGICICFFALPDCDRARGCASTLSANSSDYLAALPRHSPVFLTACHPRKFAGSNDDCATDCTIERGDRNLYLCTISCAPAYDNGDRGCGRRSRNPTIRSAPTGSCLSCFELPPPYGGNQRCQPNSGARRRRGILHEPG